MVALKHKVLGAVGALIALLALTAAILAYAFPPLAWPAPTGQYLIGTRDFDLVDETRAANERRRIAIRVWYPAGDVTGHGRRDYFNAVERRLDIPYIAEMLDMPKLAFVRFRNLTLPEYVDAPIATTGAPFPIIVFSHGYWLYGAQNTALMEHLAAHGYVVLSIAHEGDSAPVAHTDGTVGEPVPYAAPAVVNDAGERLFWGGATHDIRTNAIPVFRAQVERDRIGKSFHDWRADTVSVLRALETGRLPPQVRDLLPAADFSRLGLAGMSFGGSIAASVCRTEPHCGAAANIDGDEFDFDLYDADYPRPLLLLCSDWVRYPYAEFQVHDPSYHFDDYAYERWSTAGLSPSIFRIGVHGIRHVGFTDLILSTNRPLRDRIFGTIDGHRAVSLVNDFVLNFFDQRLKGQPSDFPAAALAAHADAFRRNAGEVRQWWLMRQRLPK